MITSPALGRYGRRPTTSFRAGLAAIGTAFNAADERRLRSIRARHLRGAALAGLIAPEIAADCRALAAEAAAALDRLDTIASGR